MSKKSEEEKPEPAKPEKDPTFEQALAELEETVRQLEDGEKSLDEGLALYERGVKSLRACHVKLDQAERRIRTLIQNQKGEPVLKEIEAVDKLVAGEESRPSNKSAKTKYKPKPVDEPPAVPGMPAEEGDDLF